MTHLIDPNRVRFGPYEVDLHTREMWKFGTRIKLVGQPFEILAVLVTRAGELVTRDELRQRLWPSETFVDFNHGLNAAVNKLRDLLSDSADDPKYIETLPRRGYRFIAKVERGAQKSEEIAAAAIVEAPQAAVQLGFAPPELATIANQEIAEPRLDSRIPRTFLGIIAGAVLLVVFGIILSSFLEKSLRHPAEATAFTASLKGTQKTLAAGGRNEGPQFSPDGKKLVFMSDRGGARDLWISDADGKYPKQLTHMGDTGTPRWSPDSRKIAFDSHLHKLAVILVVDADGGTPQLAVAGSANNSVPSWSHDGKSLYFASDRTGMYQVWRLAIEDGKQEQITEGGGFAPLESSDDETLYYAKCQFEHPEIWQVARGGGQEALVSNSVRPGTWASWALYQKEIYFVDETPGNVAMLSVYDLQSQRLRQLTLLGRFPFWFALSSDGRKAAFERLDSETDSSIIELEDFQ